MPRNPPRFVLPPTGPAILGRIGKSAGWSEAELALAILDGCESRGFFHTLTGTLPAGTAKPRSEIPMFDARIICGRVQIELGVGGCRVSCGGRDVARVTVPIRMPEMLKIAGVGMPIARVVGHELLGSPMFVIRKIEEPAWPFDSTTLTFDMPETQLRT